MSKIILLDPGHGDGNGNQAPDGSVVEWIYCRELVAMIAADLRKTGIETHILVPETLNVGLLERVRRVNGLCRNVGKENVALVSVHLNAAGGGKVWRDARGWLCFIDHNAGERSKLLATLLSEEAMKRGLKGNRRQGPVVNKYLTMTHNTLCTAVLTENLFQDNKEDVSYLLSDDGFQEIVNIHIEAISRYVFG